LGARSRRHCQRSRAFGCSAYRQSGTAEIDRRRPKMQPTFSRSSTRAASGGRHQPLEQRVLPLIERGRDDPSRAVSIWFGLPVQNPPECVLNRWKYLLQPSALARPGTRIFLVSGARSPTSRPMPRKGMRGNFARNESEGSDEAPRSRRRTAPAPSKFRHNWCLNALQDGRSPSARVRGVMILILLLGNEKPKVIYGISLQGLARRDRAPAPHHDALNTHHESKRPDARARPPRPRVQSPRDQAHHVPGSDWPNADFATETTVMFGNFHSAGRVDRCCTAAGVMPPIEQHPGETRWQSTRPERVKSGLRSG